MKPQRNYLIILIVAVLAVGAWFGYGAFQRWQAAVETQRLADIAAAIETAEALEARASELEGEALELRSELEARAVTIAASRRRIAEHRKVPIDDKGVDTRELVHSFALLGYGLPR